MFVLALVATIMQFVVALGCSDDALRDGIFQAVSITTTTGFTTSNFAAWPSVAPILLLFAANGIALVQLLAALK